MTQSYFFNFSLQDLWKPDVRIFETYVRNSVRKISYTVYYSQVWHSEKFESSQDARNIDGWPRWATQTPQTICRCLVSAYGFILDRFGLARLDFGLTEPQNPNLQGSDVEHLSFTKHQKLSTNSSWAPRSMIKKRMFLRRKNVLILKQNDLTL